jgi:four helix bundle protein
VRDFRDLKVWGKAHELVRTVYAGTRDFPREEVYGLTGQMRRSAVSIAGNIAEGCGRRTEGEMARFLEIAAGSASELEYYILLAADLGFLDGAAHESLHSRVVEVKRMLTSLRRKLRADS